MAVRYPVVAASRLHSVKHYLQVAAKWNQSSGRIIIKHEKGFLQYEENKYNCKDQYQVRDSFFHILLNLNLQRYIFL